MLSVKGYFDGENYVTEGNVAVKTNQRVIITFLDEFVHPKRDLKKFVGKISESDSDLIEKAVTDGRLDLHAGCGDSGVHREPRVGGAAHGDGGDQDHGDGADELGLEGLDVHCVSSLKIGWDCGVALEFRAIHRQGMLF